MTEKNKDVMEMDGMHIMSDAELNRKLDILLKTGVCSWRAFADTSRVLRNMKRVAAYLGFSRAESAHFHKLRYYTCKPKR